MLDVRRIRRVSHLVLFLSFSVGAAQLGADEPQASYQRQGKGGFGPTRVFKDRITPHWFADGTKCWYRNDLKGGTKEFVLVDAMAGKRDLAFDHKKLAEALAKAAGKE